MVCQPQWREARAARSWRSCTSRTYDSSSVSCTHPASRMPWLASTWESNLTFWPTLRKPGPSSQVQQFKRGAEVDLFRRCGIFMRQRQIDRLVAESERHAHQPCGHRIEADALGVKADEQSG